MSKSMLRSLVFLPVLASAGDFSGMWEAVWSNSLGRSGTDMTWALSQSGDVVVGSLHDNSGTVPFKGTSSGDSLKYEIPSTLGSPVKGVVVLRGADSATFAYSYRMVYGDSVAKGDWDSTRIVQGSGIARRSKCLRALAIDVVYEGARDIGTNNPISVMLRGNRWSPSRPTEGGAPDLVLPVFSDSGSFLVPLTDSVPFFVSACAGMPIEFDPARLEQRASYPCATWGAAAGGDSIAVPEGDTGHVRLVFGDDSIATWQAVTTAISRIPVAGRGGFVVVAQARSGKLMASIRLESASKVSLLLRDSRGRVGRVVELGDLPAGTNRIVASVTGVPDGFHIAQVRLADGARE